MAQITTRQLPTRSPTFLVVGATGNTGGGVVRTLAELLPKSEKFKNHRILAQTRNAKGAVALELAKISNIEVLEKNWTSIDADWLKENEIERIFIAAQNDPTHFTDESLFLTNALQAGIKYVVRISTTKSNIGPATKVYYARTHWAIETMLETDDFKDMAWTSLQPNVFVSVYQPLAEDWLREYKKTGKQTPFKIMLDKDAGVGIIDSHEVGNIAGHLLAQEDPSPHNRKKYVLAGPSDMSAKDIVELVEKHANTKIEDVKYRDTSFADAMLKAGHPPSVAKSLAHAPASGFDGQCSIKVEPTSPEILKLYAPKNHARDQIDAALAKI